jgi:hypothetical protein
MIHVVLRRTSLAFVAAVAACRGAADRAPVAHPTALTGRWVRLKEDGTWGDTMDFLPDGTVRGSADHPVPTSLRWTVERDSTGEQFCARDESGGFCRPYHLKDGQLELIGGPSGHTVFRRVR